MPESTRHPSNPFMTDWRANAVFFALLPALILAIPRSAPIVFFLIATISLVHLFARDDIRPKEAILTPITLTFSALAAYCILNASWSVNPAEAYGKVALFSLILVSLYLIHRAIDNHSPTTEPIARALIAGFVIGLLFLSFEFLSDQYIKRALYNLAPWTGSPSEKHMNLNDGYIVDIASYLLNRNVAFLMFALWPVLLIVTALRSWRWRYHFMLLLFITTILIVFNSNHETSYFACIISLVVFLIAKIHVRTVIYGISALWTAAFLLTLPLAHFAYKAELHHEEWLPASSRARIVLWNYTAEQVTKAPILGIGIRSTKTKNAKHKNTGYFVTEKGIYLPQKTGRHAHNLYLQTWYELGLIGVLLVLAAGLTIIHWISKRSSHVQPFALATFTTFATIAAFSWGIWQTWYMCGIALTVVTFIFADRYANKS